MRRVDRPHPQAEAGGELEVGDDGGGVEQRGVDRRLVDDVVGRLRRHGVGRGHPADGVVRLDHEHVEAGPGEVARRDEAVVAAADDDDVGGTRRRCGGRYPAPTSTC